MEDLISRRCDFDEAVLEALGSIKDRGFDYLGGVILSSQALGDYIEGEFRSSGANRSIRVTYLPSIYGHDDAIKIFVENHRGGTFSIDQYLKHIGVNAEILEKLKLKNYSGAFRERVRACLEEYDSIMNQYLASCIDGHKWQDVPIDWRGYK